MLEVAMGLEGVRVLLVEDDDLVAMSLEDTLADLGCTIAARVGYLADALERARAGGFDFAVLDIKLHGKDVFPVAEALAGQGIPFAFASGYGVAGVPEGFRDRPVVAKPFRLAELASVMAAALGR
jgi:CheY-like chemotaxis protein